MAQRVVYFDWLRVLACLMVVLTHSPMPSEAANGFLLSTISYFASPGIGIFFMISGALLLPTDQSPSVFLKRRIGKLVFPLVIWSVAYILIRACLGLQEISFKNFISIPFAPEGCAVFWFVYVLIGLYLIVPVVSPFLKDAGWKDVRIYVLVFALFFCYPILNFFVNAPIVDVSFIYYFAGYGGYFFLGWLMRRFPEKFGMKYLAIGFVVSWVSVILCRVLGWQIDFYSVFWYKSIFVVAMTMFWFKLLQKYMGKKKKVGKWILKTSNLSFGIYLVHFAIIRYFLWNQPWIQGIEIYWIQTIVIFLVGLSLSWILCAVISRLPFAKYLIGYKAPI